MRHDGSFRRHGMPATPAKRFVFDDWGAFDPYADGKQQKIEAEKILIVGRPQAAYRNVGLEKDAIQARSWLHQTNDGRSRTRDG